jgi:hypothetical protein
MHPVFVAGATAAVMHDRTRGVLRRGLVYGLAGAITAGEALFAGARGVAHSANMAAADVRLDEETLTRIEEAAPAGLAEGAALLER